VIRPPESRLRGRPKSSLIRVIVLKSLRSKLVPEG